MNIPPGDKMEVIMTDHTIENDHEFKRVVDYDTVWALLFEAAVVASFIVALSSMANGA